MESSKLCIVGLGYVGLPLAYAFAKNGYDVSGYDVNEARIAQLKEGNDATEELTRDELDSVTMTLSDDPSIIAGADVVIMALPTPIDDDNKPDLSILKSATETVGKHMKRGAIIVYESTVYPGTTEEICGPILEEQSGMTCGTDFTLGYSPERINPGDKTHTVDKIIKVVAGQDAPTTEALCKLYGSIITAGVHRAPNIKTAEMAKAIENAQRDLNIAFVNEVAKLCNKVGISTTDVLDAAGTKWNFLRFQPGLVGGHCIGVDPYYLVEKARQLNMETHVITAGRAVNDHMAEFVAECVTEALNVDPSQARVLVLGLTFKENIPDVRNSKSGKVIAALEKAGCTVCAHDSHLGEGEVRNMGFDFGIPGSGDFDAVLLLVKHEEYLENPESVIESVKPGGLVYDLKSTLNKEEVMRSGRKYVAL